MPFRPHQSARVVRRELDLAVAAAHTAQHSVLVWFTEMKRRKLFKEFGYGSMRQYAVQQLGFSETRAGDFNRLAERLATLPRIRRAVQAGQLGYTKAREIVTVASADTEQQWLEAAQGTSRKQLEQEVRRVRQRARQRRRAAITGQNELVPVTEEATPAADAAVPSVAGEDARGSQADQATGGAAATRPGGVQLELGCVSSSGGDSSSGGIPSLDVDPSLDRLAAAAPSTVSLRLTAEQRSRYDALWTALGRTPDPETLLRALATLLEVDADAQHPRRSVPRGTRAPVQIHVQLCPECAAMTAAGRPVDLADRERLECDAEVSKPGRRNAATIAPSVRRQVLARDDHRCQAPGCGHRQFLEVHHLIPRARGGTNHPSNLVTLCAGCHRAWHEHGVPAGAVNRAGVVRETRPSYGRARLGARPPGAPAGDGTIWSGPRAAWFGPRAAEWVSAPAASRRSASS